MTLENKLTTELKAELLHLNARINIQPPLNPITRQEILDYNMSDIMRRYDLSSKEFILYWIKSQANIEPKPLFVKEQQRGYN